MKGFGIEDFFRNETCFFMPEFPAKHSERFGEDITWNEQEAVCLADMGAYCERLLIIWLCYQMTAPSC